MKENKKFVEYVNGPSLAEVNNTVPIPKNTSFWKILSPFQDRGSGRSRLYGPG
jgi:manganese transport protein